MEGLAGVNHWDQCYHPDDNAPEYLYGREQLTAEVNSAAQGCFDAGAVEVRVLDGHGRNRNQGFIREKLDKRVQVVWVGQRNPIRWEGLDETVSAVAMIGQHAMAGTINGFLDHTQSPKEICRYLINGVEYGEMGQFALYAGGYGIPLVYVSGDEALCDEARRQFPHVRSTPTKRGTSWATCELTPPDEVRANIRNDIADALLSANSSDVWRLETPIEVGIEWAWSERADRFALFPNVRRPHARTVSWHIADQRDIYQYPSTEWTPASNE